MKTISFYSYKGGVGRSLALAYTARYLALKNINVCILDLDLEAPGIAYKFPEDSHNIISKLGVVDYLNSWTELLNSYNGDKTKIPNINDYFSTIAVHENNKDGYIKIINAGQGISTEEYWSNFSKIKWEKLFFEDNSKGLHVFEVLKKQIEEQLNPEYLLIDSRSGVTIASKLCNSVLPDEVIMFLANNDENIYGSKLMYNHITISRENKKNKVEKIFCVISRRPMFKNVSDSMKERKTTYDPNDEKDLISRFIKTVDNPELKEEDISIIYSNRVVELNELLLFKKQSVESEIIEEIEKDYNKLIEKFVDKKLLERRDSLTPRVPRYRFIKLELHEIIQNEIKELCGDMTPEEYFDRLKSDSGQDSLSCQYLYKLALCERYAENIKEATLKLYTAIDNAKGNDNYRIKAIYLRGIIFLYDYNNYENAFLDLEMVYKLDKYFSDHILYHLAVCTYCLGEDKKALNYIALYFSGISDTVRENDSMVSRVYLLRAVINGDKKTFTENKIDSIINDYDESISHAINHKGPYFASLYNCRGLFYDSLSKIDDAISDFDTAIHIDPEYRPAYYHRGLDYAMQGKVKKAIKDFTDAIRIEPKFKYAYYQRGLLYTKLGETQKALFDFNKAIEIDPDYDKAHNAKEKILIPIEYYKSLEIDIQQDLMFYLPKVRDIGSKISFPVKYCETGEYFEFVIREYDNNRRFLSDQGKTLKMLRKLNEKFKRTKRGGIITMEIVSILNEFQVLKNENEFLIELLVTDSESEHKKVLDEDKYRMFHFISFMNKLHIFYDNLDNPFRKEDYIFKKFVKTKNYKQMQSIGRFIEFPKRYHRPDIMNPPNIEYKFVFVQKGNDLYISDQGSTYTILDNEFELDAPDVQKYLSAIMNECKVLQNGDEFFIKVTSSSDQKEKDKASHKLLECISFMYTMRIFFVNS